VLIGKLANAIETAASKIIALISAINQPERLSSISVITM